MTEPRDSDASPHPAPEPSHTDYQPPALEPLGSWSALTLQQSIPIGPSGSLPVDPGGVLPA